jgi:hypothetical protein
MSFLQAFKSFVFPTKIGRLSFLVRSLLCNFFSYWCFMETDWSGVTKYFLVIGLGLYDLFFVIFPRVKDCGVSRWMTLLILFPPTGTILSLVLLFKRSRLSFVPTIEDENSASTLSV